LSVEFRADAAIGDVEIQKKTGVARIDEDAIRAARHHVFLPAVENRAFATAWHKIETRFSNQNN
jgi:hypothetical protein